MSKLNVPLKTALTATGKKQKRIARSLHISETRLSHIVRGHRPASETEKKKLAAFLDKPEADLFDQVTA